MREVKSKKANAESFLFPKPEEAIFFCKSSFFRLSIFALAFLIFTSSVVSAQEEPTEDLAPPPLKIISKAEKSSLAAETDISDRTKLSLELMETRLKKAEDLNARNMFADMFGELGTFDALIDDSLSFLNKADSGRGKTLNNLKRLELNFRKFIPRLELIRRELPQKYETYVRKLIKNVREARTKAVEPFFDDSVVPNAKGN